MSMLSAKNKSLCLSLLKLLIIMGLTTSVSLLSFGESAKTEKIKWLVKPQFESVGDFSEGLALFEKSDRSGYIDKKGKIVIEGSYIFADDMNEGIARAIDGDKWVLINSKGERIKELAVSWVENFSEGLAAININGSYSDGKLQGGTWGYISTDGNIVIDPLYEYAGPFSEGMAVVKKDKKLFIIDREQKIKKEIKYDEIFNFKEGMARFKKDGKFGFINKDFKEVIPPQYDRASDFCEGVARAIKNKKWIYIDQKGEERETPFTWIGDFSEGMAPVKIKDKFGFIDKNYNIVIEPKFDRAWNFSEGLAAVMISGKWGFIDKKGVEVIKAQFDEVWNFRENIAGVCQRDRWGFIKNPLSAESQSEQLEYAGMLVGTVKAIEGNEIIITGSNIGKNVMLFDKLCVFSDEEMIILSAHFPMMTVAKCKISSGDISLIKPGMKVYKYKKEIKKKME